MAEFTFTEHLLGRLCDQLLGVQGWRPAIDGDELPYVLATLSACESQLERMFLLGAVHRLEFFAFDRVPLMPASVRFAGQTRPGIQLGGARNGFACAKCVHRADGPHGLIFVPQFPLRGRSWDFGILSSSFVEGQDDEMIGLVQVDGYAVHRDRRRLDASIRRDASQAGVPVFAVYEESHSPSFWFDAVIHHWWHREEPSQCPAARTCDVLLPEPMEAA